jgi:hypothetical protein
LPCCAFEQFHFLLILLVNLTKKLGIDMKICDNPRLAGLAVIAPRFSCLIFPSYFPAFPFLLCAGTP